LASKLAQPALEVVALVEAFLEHDAQRGAEHGHPVQQAPIREAPVVEVLHDGAQGGGRVARRHERGDDGPRRGADDVLEPHTARLHVLHRADQSDALYAPAFENRIRLVEFRHGLALLVNLERRPKARM
jgi:hypothetical protein